MNYTVREAAKAMSGVLGCDSDNIIRGVSTDTRTIKDDDLFFALVGDTHDGHNYIGKIRTCAGVVTERPIEGLSFPCIVVEDTLKALGAFAAFHKAQCNPLTIGITGSVGKTSTKEMTAMLLEGMGSVVKTYANYNNEIGLPATVFKLDDKTRTAVFEMGMRGPGQIKYLCDIASPTIGVITNIGFSHIELLKTQDAIADAKSELLQALPENGAGFVSWDGRYHKKLKNSCRGELFTFGATTKADIFPESLESFEGGFRYSVRTPFGRIADITLPTPAEYNVINSLAAIGVAHYCGISADYIKERLAEYKSIQSRFNIIHSPMGLVVIDDTYNANPASMNGAVNTLVKLEGIRKTTILGDMLELGEYAEECHFQLGQAIALLGIDRLFTVGRLSENIAAGAREAGMDPDNIFEYESSAQLSEKLSADDFVKGECVLVKGSHSMNMNRISFLLSHI